jgi:UDP-2-acetamido-3-amino-2,3-dideoxy-glucuronate N-acetyltransferase
MIASSADISKDAFVHPSAIVWDDVQVREHASIAEEATIGRGVYIGPGVKIGPRVKIQNGAMIFDPAIIKEGAFIGPGVILTNDKHPRSINSDWTKRGPGDWQCDGVSVGVGASIGAGAICVAHVSIGDWSLVGAGTVVVRDVIPHALVIGNPGQRRGWVGEAGFALCASNLDRGIFECPSTGRRYREVDGQLQLLDHS